MEQYYTLKLNIYVIADLSLAEPTPTTLQVEAAVLEGSQTVDTSTLFITPFAPAEPFLDFYSNPCRRLLMPGGDVRLEYTATVTQPDERYPLLKPYEADALHLPTDTLLYTLPSRYCQSDKLVAMASDMFGDVAPRLRARADHLQLDQRACDLSIRHVGFGHVGL